MKATAPLLLVVLAAVFVVLAVLYAAGVLALFSSTGPGHPHYKHAIVLVVLAVASLIAANFARQRQQA